MELSTPVFTKIMSRFARVSSVIAVCLIVAIYGDQWAIGEAYPLISPFHRAMVIVTILFIALTFTYGWPRYLFMALVLINVVWWLGPFLTLGTSTPLGPFLLRLLICSCIALLAIGYFIAKRFDVLPPRLTSFPFLRGSSPTRFPEIVIGLKEWRAMRRHAKRQIPLYKRLFFRTEASTLQPCVVIVGPSKSGKTAALQNAELIWTSPSQQQDARHSLSMTKHPQLWWAEDALWCDTPGRYFDPEQMTAETSEEWQALTQQLVSLQPVARIEAVLFVIDSPRLLTSTPQQLTEYAALCRAHLRELSLSSDRQLPLYIMVSQIDQLSGFQEYFHDISLKERYQLLGETFSLDANKPMSIKTIHQQLISMSQRIEHQVLNKQHHCEEAADRRGIERFPVNIDALVTALMCFIEPLVTCRTERVTQDTPVLQGIYLGCSMLSQESRYSHPDSLIAQWLDDTDGNESAIASKPPESLPDQTMETSRPLFQHYLIKHLFQYRIIDDFRLRQSLYLHRFTTRFRHSAVFAIIIVVSTLMVYGLTQAYYANQRFLADSWLALNRLEKQLMSTQIPLDSALNKLNQLAMASYPSQVQSPLRLSNWGLAMDKRWAEKIDSVYDQWLLQHLLPMLEKVAHEDLARQLTKGEPQTLLITLSAYLMLIGELESDRSFLAKRFSSHPALLSVVEREDTLPLLLQRLFRIKGWQSSSRTVDKSLIESTRQQLLLQPVSGYLYYDILQQLKEVPLPIADLPKLITTSHPLLFAFQGASDPAAGLYNLQGVQYWDNHVPTKHFPESLRRVGNILYGKKLSPLDSVVQQHWQQVSLLFLQAYRRHWQDFLNGVQLSFPLNEYDANQGQGSNRIAYVLKDFTRQDSQLRQLLINVANQTQLTAALGRDNPKLSTDWGKQGDEERQRRRDNVDHYFMALHRFVEPPSSTVTFSLAQLEIALTQLYLTLQATGIATEHQFRALMTEQATIPGGNTLLRHLDQLPPPLPRLFNTLLSVAQRQVTQHAWAINAERIEQEILHHCRQHLMGRYPFASSNIEADPVTVAEMFSPQGKLARYFTQYLADKVDTHHRPWRFVTADHAISPQLLTLFEQGKKIQQYLFPYSSSPLSVNLTLSIHELANGITQLMIDNDKQHFRYVHGPLLTHKIHWPVANPAASFQIRAVAAEGRSLWSIEETGFWGVLRWLERSKKKYEPRRRETVVTLGDGMGQARLKVNGLGTSVPYLISLFRQFDCTTAE
ncbi:type VI secretion system membrane subunit TssM [Tatumella ptyseos]|uniref:type VI secretion system membrane subunit TssM n=1 Tax=Tatumella ptyseos TaxID=82987 RepID=UPI0026EF8E81|nr:type VI secretion system membrane subunit TssM [Tatumella ptyseos]WKX27316.1 type VI secretion system membrane subunit TssM [Tatumella ptyseos]